MKLALKGGGKIGKKPFFKWPMFDQCEKMCLLKVKRGPKRS